MERLNQKIALVTGASAGIGAATVTKLLSSGMVVIGMARRLAKLQELSNAADYYPLEGDVTKDEDVERVFRFIEDNFGTLHVLINNAGIAHIGKILSTSPDIWKRTMEVNVLGLTLCCKHAVTLMRKSGADDGHIININSIAGHGLPDRNDPIMNMYPASKNAVTVLTETIRFELVALGSSIKISSISPGYTDTEFFHLNDVPEGLLSETCIKDFNDRPRLSSSDVADAVVSVLSTPPHVLISQLTIKPVGEPV